MRGRGKRGQEGKDSFSKEVQPYAQNLCNAIFAHAIFAQCNFCAMQFLLMW